MNPTPVETTAPDAGRKPACGRPCSLDQGRFVFNCKLSLKGECANCGQQLCGQHLRNRCPEGRRSRYGTQQHLTRDHLEALSQAEDHRLEKVQISQGMGPEGHWRAPTVVISYRCRDGQPGRVILHPGTLVRDPGMPGVRPGEELHRWLARRLGEERTRELRWTDLKGCQNIVAEAVRNPRSRTGAGTLMPPGPVPRATTR